MRRTGPPPPELLRRQSGAGYRRRSAVDPAGMSPLGIRIFQVTNVDLDSSRSDSSCSARSNPGSSSKRTNRHHKRGTSGSNDRSF